MRFVSPSDSAPVFSKRSLVLVLALGLSLSACGDEEAACEVGSEMQFTELFFGMDRENAEPVSEAEWQGFVDTIVTPRFRDGLTMFDADGQYMMDTGNLVHENSKVILLLHDGSAARSRDIDTIREEYKQQFQQESVLRIDSTSCVAF
ncbi:DUF3574 domain-containing protein [Stigmatella aurantiaca]|uniref:Conserved uncharacterized protein n=1 Tax=Stigmatella aurantiaca (strain DW4/3-1) TaxID=378806 RepID=Q09DH5_STIAD|nr:DUF3574 domain-containing protein [Stigmatella aurantiaca]ADO69337.1 conserved uncharacterized protein [Stigmatella aurantiaca DW4/3-1]EAU69808.1 conserved hypothetical protein [Stigmatella aurantiaca DW4/3-1]